MQKSKFYGKILQIYSVYRTYVYISNLIIALSLPSEQFAHFRGLKHMEYKFLEGNSI
jgi:hypothetical protein